MTASKGLRRPRGKRPKLRALHRHGCLTCGHVYTDSACADPYMNARCQACRTSSHRRPVWETDLDPETCCRTASKVATFEELETFALGGETEWWVCKTCARTQPYDPLGAP